MIAYILFFDSVTSKRNCGSEIQSAAIINLSWIPLALSAICATPVKTTQHISDRGVQESVSETYVPLVFIAAACVLKKL